MQVPYRSRIRLCMYKKDIMTMEYGKDKGNLLCSGCKKTIAWRNGGLFLSFPVIIC